MSKQPPSPPPEPILPPLPRRRWLPPLAAVGGVVLLLALLFLIGESTRDWLRGQDRATISFADIDCDPPPGLTRTDFLDEVQYLSDFSDRVRLLDDDSPKRLAESFALHPWVEKVEQVEIQPRRVRVQLSYRTPVLAVPLAGQTRAVDRHGVLLPANTPTEGLPLYRGVASPPKGDAGKPWGDPAIEAAARAK